MLYGANSMAIRLAVRKLIAREDARRAETNEPRLTQQVIAEGSGVSQPVISSLISGKIKRIDLKTINGLCGFFGVPPGELFEYTPDREQE